MDLLSRCPRSIPMDPTNDNKIYHATLIEWLVTHAAAPTVDTGSTGLISELRAIRSQSEGLVRVHLKQLYSPTRPAYRERDL